tara:strand:+ start:142 stop:357 length:216 start_codon:yes stop_codon:yes gene_type:complete
MKPGDLVHFIDCKETQYDTLGMIIGFMTPKSPDRLTRNGLFRVVWYDDPSCSVEDYDKEDLEKVSEGWRLG